MLKQVWLKITALGVASILTGSIGLAELQDPASQTQASDLENVTGQYSLTEAKRDQYNSFVTEASQLSGEGNVIVKLKGDALYDIYAASDAEDFSAYAASGEGERYSARLAGAQEKVMQSMRAQGISYQFKYSYTALTNAFSVKVAYSDVAAIAAIDGVEDVYYSTTYAVPEVTVSSNDANVYPTGIYDSSDVEYKGEGMVVAILDTGLDYTHAAFQNMPTSEDIWSKDYVASRFDSTLAKTSRMTSATVDDVYINAKVPYAFDYADNDCNVYPSYSSHGTHVAGIIAGRDDGKTVGEDQTFVGVAPEAQLAIMKVFTDDLDSPMLGGADTADILAAVNDCAVLGVDVINMSLGSTCGFTSEATDEFLTTVYGNVEALGISLVVAAGNEYSAGYGGGNGTNLASNPDSGTVGSPSTYSAALSVASINGQESPYLVANEGRADSIAYITNAVDTYSNDIEFVDLLMEQFSDLVTTDGKLELNYVVIGGVGRSANYTSTIRRYFTDGRTVALVRRGDISFTEKVQNAMNAGAVGVIIYNNISGGITMSLADLEDPVPTCSINLASGTEMVNNAVGSRGTITLCADYTAGPYMSDFSSWGVTPDLKLKPEITAHGGEILSAVAGGYDTYSGTSMAAPNMAGAVALLRQHVKETTDLSGKALNARVNQLLMSTATMALNQDGNPYSPRKQGAGLADILSAVHTQAYIGVPDGDGGYRDKTKLELGDDPERAGIYSAEFTVINQTSQPVSYTFVPYVFTETLSLNGETVDELAYMLDDASVVFTAGGRTGTEGDTITVPANGEITISVTVTLSETDKDYLNKSFVNGMYVEGFFRLEKEGDAYTDLSIPFLAFYGDWADAPMFDYSIYELAVTDADTSIDEEDKPVASARATTPLGLYDDGQYIMPLGSYLYLQSEEDVEIFPDSDKAAISMYDEENRKSLYQLYMIYGGLLRGAKTMEITITDAVTGEVMYEKTENNVRKAYAGGGANVGAPVAVDMNPYEWGLANNREYIFTMKGTLDWKDGTASSDSFEFNFHVDYEAPTIQSYSVRYEPYTENRETHYRIWLDVTVYDNQYVQDILPCYVKDNTLYLLTEYVVPVYSTQNSETTVSIDITDYYDDYRDNIYLGVEDYALNQNIYHLNLNNATTYSDTIMFEEEAGKFVQTGTRTSTSVVNGVTVRNEYGTYALTLSPNEAYELSAITSPDDTYAYKLDWSTTRSSVAVASECEIFAKAAGTAVISVRDGNGLTKAQITVTVTGEEGASPNPERLSFRPIVNKDNNVQAIADSGSIVELYPYTTVQLHVDVEPWYVDGLTYEWTSTNEDVLTVDENGVITTLRQGTAYVTCSAVGYSRVSTTLRVNVVSEFYIQNYTLYGYHGGPDVVIPDELNVLYLDKEAFNGNREIRSLVLPKTLLEVPEEAFRNCTALETVYIPSETTVIGESAFEGCVSLRTLQLGEFVDEDTGEVMTGALTVGRRGFANCISLETIENPRRLTTVGVQAFMGCTSLTTLDVSALALAYESAFENCVSLETITFSSFTNASENMFRGCTSLREIVYSGHSVADGMFDGCTALEQVTFTSELSYIGERAFAGTALSSVSIPGGTVTIGDAAFEDCAGLTRVEVCGNTVLQFAGAEPFAGCADFAQYVTNNSENYVAEDGVLYNAARTEIVAVPVAVEEVILPDTVTAIGNSVFAGRTSLTSFDFGNVISIGSYAFAGTGLSSVHLPASLRNLGEGAFEGCSALSSAEIAGTALTQIPARAFASCSQLQRIECPDTVVSIGEGAFENSALASIVMDGVEEIGSRAFYGSRLGVLVLPASVNAIGDEAFASIPSLRSVTLPAITTMGSYVFVNCPMLTTAVFGEGTTCVGEFAFAALNGTSALTTVELPDSVREIGQFAFYMCEGLTEINLSRVQTIGTAAFMGTGLRSVQTEASEIGDIAFAMIESLRSAELSGAQTIGAMAFAVSGLTEVEMPSVRVIGANAFSETYLTTVELPATMSEYSYDRSMTLYLPSEGKIGEKVMRAESMGSGAFADIATLTEISVDAGNPVYFDIDGVLYARVANGYTLVQYPSAKTGEDYTVLDGTVRIEAEAFRGVQHLVNIELPSVLKSVGSLAFYNSSIKNYTFHSVAAPVLDSTYVDVSTLSQTDILYTIFATQSNTQLGSQVFYANFYDYVALITEERNLNDSGIRYTAPSFGLSITYPVNGTGYDNLIWNAFFETRSLSEYAADETTTRAIAAIEALPSVEEIEAITSLAELEELSASRVTTARTLYNSVNDTNQLALITDYDRLLDVEAAVRAARTRLGSASVVTALRILSRPDKLIYVDGETFDATGLRVIAIYEDLSEEEITGFTVDKTTMSVGDTFVTVTYQGVSQTFNVSVSARPSVSYTVTFAGEGVEQSEQVVSEGDTVIRPEDPVREGYVFEGWFVGENAYDFNAAVTSDLTLTARWSAATTDGGGCAGSLDAGFGAAAAILVVAACGIVLHLRSRKDKN